MHSSIIITTLCAALAVAKPLRHHHAKKDVVVVTHYAPPVQVTSIVEVTVFENEVAAATVQDLPKAKTVVVVETYYAAAKSPSPAPIDAASRKQKQQSSSIQQVVPVTTVIAPVVPPTSAAPVVIVSTSSAAPTPVAAAVVKSGAVAVTGDYKTIVLDHHNRHRANHSASDLAWNSTLAAWAQKTANTCVFEHVMNEGTGHYGQNIVSVGQFPWHEMDLTSAAANGITESWYNGEEPAYNHAGAPYGSSYGLDNPAVPETVADILHFTQMIWGGSRTVGCATKQCEKDTSELSRKATVAYTVCNYFPQGNFGGEYDVNVARPLGQPTINAKLVFNAPDSAT
ncbi:CAP domain-containing protein [Amylocarpus encephaloides]|uniref:CAP domain-containing protein n=1 Tax=Amylocarpus encephaloides TaxID=45428 RepID=A0A9P7Y7L0_9HELO|nr:CAP domain-containing protein [Amylocarpus encephaloides]